jgi:alginate O-acetyltransferase complex protein AlgI
MHFVSQPFIGFFVAVFAGYWLLPWHRARMVWLLGASAAFYMSWNPLLIALVLLSATIDFVAALGLDRSNDERVRRGLLVGSITTNLALLAYFKYVNFFLDNLHGLGNWLGLDFDRPILHVVLPLGISFYTFETISYVVDVYRRKVRAERDPVNYALFILFFPHLIAGPIVRPGDFLPQTRRRKRWSWMRAYIGARLFLLGFCKKAVLADGLAHVVDPVFRDPASFTAAATWLAVIAYAFQIYGDFSGYSDMAIGIAHAFGFKLHANFDMPYLSANIAEFWRRWHISLSTWLRDYLYIPLGGNRNGELATYRNLMLTMLLGGLWHGASWTFVAWGLLHGSLLAAHRFLGGLGIAPRLPRTIGVVITFFCVCVGWVFFRAQTFEDAGTILMHLFAPLGYASPAPLTMLAAVLCLAAMIVGHALGRLGWDRDWDKRLPAPVVGAALGVFVVLLLLFVADDGKSFIYFQF